MPDNKRQHFVPKFYLRNFADSGGDAIGVFHIRTGQLFRRASLKTQAYRNYFYGKDGEAERHFGDIEGAASHAISSILVTGRPPRRFGPDHFRLVYFLMLQSARTARSEADENMRVDAIAKSLMRQQELRPETLEALGRVKIVDKDAVLSAIHRTLIGAPSIYDLRFKLIRNVSSHPFVASDHPVVLHNQLLEAVVDLNVVGFGAAGLQVLLPLSPEYALLFYDDYVYEVGRPASNVVRLVAERHADQLNAFQWYGAQENVYPPPVSTEEDLRAMASAVTPLRGNHREWMEEEVLERTATQKRVRTIFRTTNSPLKLDVPFIRLRGPRPDVSDWEDIPMRHPEWMMTLLEWTRALEEGALDLDTFRALTAQVPQRPKARGR